MFQKLQILCLPLPVTLLQSGSRVLGLDGRFALQILDIAIWIGYEGRLKAVFQRITDHLLLAAGMLTAPFAIESQPRPMGDVAKDFRVPARQQQSQKIIEILCNGVTGAFRCGEDPVFIVNEPVFSGFVRAQHGACGVIY
jgi:hypothetical protein